MIKYLPSHVEKRKKEKERKTISNLVVELYKILFSQKLKI
jgi:hypothetical protein